MSSGLRRFREASPGVAIALEEAGTGELVEALLRERLDAAFVRSPVGSVPGLEVDDLLDEPMVAALPAGHPLNTGTATPLPLSDLAAQHFVLYRRPTGPGLHDAILAACHAAGFNPTVAQEAPRLTATLSLVAAGLGVSVVPASMRILGGEGVAYRPLTGCPGLSAPIHLAIRRSGSSPILTRFRRLAREFRQPSGSVGATIASAEVLPRCRRPSDRPANRVIFENAMRGHHSVHISIERCMQVTTAVKDT